MFTVFDLRTNKKLLITIYIRYHLLISLKKKKKSEHVHKASFIFIRLLHIIKMWHY